MLVGCDLRFWHEAGALLDNTRISGYLGWLRVQSWMFAAPYLRAAGELEEVCWDRHPELVDRIEARDVSGAHRVVNEYNLFTVELLARLTGRPLESVAVLPLLRSSVEPVVETVAEPVRPASADEIGLGLVPLPRAVPPGRFGRPRQTEAGAGTEEPVAQ